MLIISTDCLKPVMDLLKGQDWKSRESSIYFSSCLMIYLVSRLSLEKKYRATHRYKESAFSLSDKLFTNLLRYNQKKCRSR